MWTHIDKNIIERKYGGNMNQITENFWPPNEKLMNYCNPISEKTMKLKSKA
jgi:allantoicase